MTAAPLFVPVLPPGTSPARPTPGEGASDGAGLFAVLLAGTQPLRADVAQGVDPTARPAPALAPALAGDVARPPAAPGPKTPPPELPTPGTVAAEASGTVPAVPALPPTLPVAAQAGSGQGSPLSQLARASADPGPPPAFAQSADRTRTPLAPHPALAGPPPGRTQAAGATAAPLPPTVAPATRAAATPFGPLQAARTPPAPPEAVPIALAASAEVPPRPRGWPLETGTPRAATDAPPALSRRSLSAAVGDRSIVATGREAGRPQAMILAPVSSPPGLAAGQPAADEQVWLEPSVDAPEGAALARSDQATTEPARAPALGRSAPPPPIFQIGVQIARAAPARIDRLFVQLEPASLGRVEVRLEFHRDHQVSAVIAAERPDTLDALQRDARVLERSLQQAGLRLDSHGLTFSLKREQAHDQPREERGLAPPADDLGEQPLPAAHRHEPAPVQWFRGLRALDIKV